MAIEKIKVRGARTHNLKNIDVDISKNKLTVITGLSGSGKSSLAFDTIYAEGQRRYVESLSSYARQFLGLMDKPDVDLIEGLSPAISIDQKSTGHNPRSTVGTVTEIYDYLRLLFARVGHPRSHKTGERLQKQTVQQIVDSICELPQKLKFDKLKIMIIAPVIKSRKGTYEELFTRFLAQGFARVRVDGQIYSLEEDITLERYVKHNIDLIIDRLVLNNDSKDDDNFIKRLTDSVELALSYGNGEIYVHLNDFKNYKSILKTNENGDLFYSEKLVDPTTGESFPEIEPHSFSFNSPHGACSKCGGLGFIKEIDLSLVYNPRLTVMEGGIYPWNRIIDNENSYMMKLIHNVAKKEGFSLKKPIGELSKKHFDILMFGLPDKTFEIEYTDSYRNKKKVSLKYEGVIPNLMRRYQESESEYVRSEIEQYMFEKVCPECNGYRLKKESLSVTINGLNIVDVVNMSIKQAKLWVSQTKQGKAKLQTSQTMQELFGIQINDDDSLSNQELVIGKQVFKEIESRLDFLLAVGLEYLTLSRSAKTLSGGESQRIRLASQIGTGLTGVLYVLDEPSIGLHQRDNERLIRTLENLRDIGNTVIVVEHDEDTINRADYIIDIGPGAGEKGGEVVYAGDVEGIKKVDNSITGKYLSKKLQISKNEIEKEVKQQLGLKSFRKVNNNKIIVTNVQENNLKGFDCEFPLGKFVAVTGVSGSGKSTLVNEILYKALAKELNGNSNQLGKFGTLRGIEHIDKVIDIDQSPIGRTPRSNPATYTGIFTEIRNIFAQTKEARARGYKPGRFSFNVKGGRCEACQGAGVIQISMQFLPDVYVKCDECNGKRYNRETLQIDYKGKNISEVLDMTVNEALSFFENIPKIKTKLKTLNDVGLGYIRLGQGATTLSGGESQRVKLATELSKRSTGKTFYILDEPTTGLHFEDVRKLLLVLHGLVAKGNTVLVIEHNLDVIKTADWIIDLGPEGGDRGGEIVVEGSVEDVMNCENSYTGQWLKKII
ncbi:MAG: UvrABC system protein A [Candidatus Dojkabacteria bacterium]|nr:MAG: UvrABC system protein A [Candidatus Dojkabacteria bacterium]